MDIASRVGVSKIIRYALIIERILKFGSIYLLDDYSSRYNFRLKPKSTIKRDDYILEVSILGSYLIVP